MFTEASSEDALNKVSPLNSFTPATETFSRPIDNFGKWRNTERLTSLKFTVASTFLLISVFTRLTILLLKTMGRKNKRRSKTKTVMPVYFSIFLIRIWWCFAGGKLTLFSFMRYGNIA
jgi:uncharacterized protein Veg